MFAIVCCYDKTNLKVRMSTYSEVQYSSDVFYMIGSLWGNNKAKVIICMFRNGSHLS